MESHFALGRVQILKHFPSRSEQEVTGNKEPARDGDQIVTVVLLSPHRLRVKMKEFEFFNVKKGKKTS